MAAPFPGYLNCSSLGLSSWVFGLGRGTAVPLEILGRGTSGCGPRALRRSRAGGGGPFGHQPRRRSHCRTRTRRPKLMLGVCVRVCEIVQVLAYRHTFTEGSS